MYQEIKKLADEAIALQNKNRMDAVLREISGIAYQEMCKTAFDDVRAGVVTDANAGMVLGPAAEVVEPTNALQDAIAPYGRTKKAAKK